MFSQLKESSKLLGARWTAWLVHSHGEWGFTLQYGLNKARKSALMEFLGQPKTSAWLAGAFSSGRVRTGNFGRFSPDVGCQRLYIFPNPQAHSSLLVGADELTRESQAFFRILALRPPDVS